MDSNKMTLCYCITVIFQLSSNTIYDKIRLFPLKTYISCKKIKAVEISNMLTWFLNFSLYNLDFSNFRRLSNVTQGHFVTLESLLSFLIMSLTDKAAL
ncbi:hypothetical protein SAMN02745170_01005 [Propionispora hippei DSM 15287]|uniref:Uncharacterized protein n=1 Tax=Propionispora hippei DSM 15287 TaxID=1123003 RepID=A0A1M6DUK2_9FIRM|nr:hypothetical protein SAMN02745170_01005 [Propionispora hippei DSM 15287]